MEPQTKYWVNGQSLDYIAANDRGLAYGDGCFTTIAILNHQLQHFFWHMKRIEESCHRLAILLTPKTLQDITRFLCQQTQTVASGYCKLTITRSQGRGYQPPQDAKITWIVAIQSQKIALDMPQKAIALNFHHQTIGSQPLFSRYEAP